MGDSRTLGGRWRVLSTTSPYVATGDRLTIFAGADGLELAGTSASPGSVVPWDVVEASKDWDSGTVTVELGDGTSVALRPEDGAEPLSLIAAIHEWRDEVAAIPRRSPYAEHPAGPNRLLVVYPSGDTGEELDPGAFLEAVAADARWRAEHGWTLVSLVGLPVRHAGAKDLFSVAGSGYTTKAAMGGLYARS